MANGDGPSLAVRDYYDANTWKFLLAGGEQAIHRELWGPGVTSRGEAVHHTHAVVLDQLGPGDRRVLDLGCGVGTSALYLAQWRPVEVVGVSISPTQVRLADRFAARGAPLRGRVRFAVADFAALPSDLTGFDLAFAIESFVHADPAAAFFDQAARALRPGGALVVVDDVRAGDRDDPRSTTSGPGGTPRACSRRPSPRRSRSTRGWRSSPRTTSPRCSPWAARGTGSSTPPCRCCAGSGAARCGRSRWSAGTPCSTATAPACSSTECSASSARRRDATPRRRGPRGRIAAGQASG
jgi:SAM-dependent methyltransferase